MLVDLSLVWLIPGLVSVCILSRSLSGLCLAYLWLRLCVYSVYFCLCLGYVWPISGHYIFILKKCVKWWPVICPMLALAWFFVTELAVHCISTSALKKEKDVPRDSFKINESLLLLTNAFPADICNSHMRRSAKMSHRFSLANIHMKILGVYENLLFKLNEVIFIWSQPFYPPFPLKLLMHLTGDTAYARFA